MGSYLNMILLHVSLVFLFASVVQPMGSAPCLYGNCIEDSRHRVARDIGDELSTRRKVKIKFKVPKSVVKSLVQLKKSMEKQGLQPLSEGGGEGFDAIPVFIDLGPGTPVLGAIPLRNEEFGPNNEQVPLSDGVKHAPRSDSVIQVPLSGSVEQVPHSGSIRPVPLSGSIGEVPFSGILGQLPISGSIGQVPLSGSIRQVSLSDSTGKVQPTMHIHANHMN